MQIIFGDSVNLVRGKFTVLELDTFVVTNTNQTVTAWCVVDNMPLQELSIADHLAKLHQDVIEQFGQKHWNFCIQSLEHLKGRWGGELDSFYQDLETRIRHLEQNPPGPDWTPVRIKTV